jgi:hypothetical protein
MEDGVHAQNMEQKPLSSFSLKEKVAYGARL